MSIKLIVDGNNIANRAFFAFKNLCTDINSINYNTGVIFGFTKFMVDLGIKYNTSDITVVWDSGSSYRRRIYPEYKAGRDHSHYSDMMSQVSDLCRLLSMMNIKQARADGYEADDVIHTLIEKDMSDDIKIIFSSDKDLLLNIREDVMVHQPGTHKVIDISGIEDVFGVSKSRLLDFFALRGDKSDNIPGVPGIGDKTAQKIINHCGSIENALQLHPIPGVPQSKINALKEFEDQLFMSKQLVTPILVDDIEIDEPIADIFLVKDMLEKYAIKTIKIELFFANIGDNNATN